MGWIDMIPPYFGRLLANLDQTKQIHSKIRNEKIAKIFYKKTKPDLFALY